MMVARMAQFAALFGGGRSSDRGGTNPISLFFMTHPPTEARIKAFLQPGS
jgi:Zn-dependent protease with chaperone function